MRAFAEGIVWARDLQQHAPVSGHHERAVSELWPWLADKKIRSALEIGCGEPPYLTARMLRTMGIETVTVDAVSRCDVAADAHDLPFARQSFDLVAARHVLEHVLCPYVVLMEMQRVSKRWILVVVPRDSEKSRAWPDHLWHMGMAGWERIFWHLRLNPVAFEEGDHTEPNVDWVDEEWRYLLEKTW